MKEPFFAEAMVGSPSKESVTNIENCYTRNIFYNSSFAGSRRALRSGAEKLSKTFRSVRNTFGSISQRFRLSGRRKHRLTESVTPCRTPSTHAKKKKQLLGRSPTKLYSPFGIETPNCQDCRMSPYMPDSPDHGLSPKRQKGMTQSWHLLSKKRPRALFH